ncbi:hypothetical protein H9L12_09000 [Sphingomonas rhizophila]|uniref:Uncharacterized protein n=1 Tax=Sphingomonas rhizophila TaxID=2071607 RepID=A0A7G9S9D3_9SPHN|nr:hypothetical protein [Sphingomonas rhizophila]QNN64458.1 hypothetical protein H9L12_09000 [Sphingomonas rhizophila]
MSVDERYEPQRRIRIGLTGLAFVFLLVLLGTAISRSGEDGVTPPANTVANADVEPNEPLAEIGAAPGQSAGDVEAERDANAAAPK